MGRARAPHYSKFPAPYFGGKSHAASVVWQALGDPAHYVEPFCGSCAVLLNRPHLSNRTYHSETVTDADGYLVNALRSLRQYPDETAAAASIQVSTCDLTAVHLWLVRWASDEKWRMLSGDPEWCDPVAGGRWLWLLSTWIGGDVCTGTGPWTTDADGRLYRQPPARCEPGVSHRRPTLGNNGKGVNRPQLREPGVERAIPHLGNDGKGVNRPQLREPGVGVECDGDTDTVAGYHPMVMPRLREWFAYLSARLRHVRILQGDWTSALTPSASLTLSVRTDGRQVCGVFCDPPYGATRSARLYRVDSVTVQTDVRQWCLEHGDDRRYRIVLAGYAGEGHEELERHGWRSVSWYRHGWLRGGYANRGRNGTQQHRERLWLSPHCLPVTTERDDPNTLPFGDEEVPEYEE